MWKAKTSILEPDERFRNMAGISSDGLSVGQFKIEDLYELVSPLNLHEKVPKEIKDQFDQARNAFLYSWFAYDLVTLAEQQSYAVVEAAIKCRAKEAGTGLNEKTGLRGCIDHAVAKHWLKKDEFNNANNNLSGLDILVLMRNELMHGRTHLIPNGSLTMMTLAHDVICALFRDL